MSSEGMQCDECERRHKEWEKVSESSFANGMYAGIRERFECGHCGGMTAQVRS